MIILCKYHRQFMINLCKYHRQTGGQTDRQTHQKYSSEPHNTLCILFFPHLQYL